MRFLFFALIFLITNDVTLALPLNLLKLPPGFSINIYAEPVKQAREMVLGANSTVFVGSFSGDVYALVPDAKSPHGTRVYTIASGLTMPNGVAFRNGALYVAEIGRILRFDNIEQHLENPPKPVIVTDALPKEAWHGWRFIRFGPEGKLYIAIGVPCNVCLPKDPRFGTISRIDPNGQNLEIYVKGIRNCVGFDWDPHNQKMWFSDNGRDYMGDDLPPDKLNFVPQQGLDFGFPYYDGKNLPDPEFGKLRKHAANITWPTHELPAHVAALGVTFYTGTMFPAEYRNQIFLAEHGSWNRTSKVGYQVMLAKIANNKVVSVTPFITGWLQGQRVWGRPVATLVMPDGSLLVSDDFAGVIYRVSYTGISTKSQDIAEKS